MLPEDLTGQRTTADFQISSLSLLALPCALPPPASAALVCALRVTLQSGISFPLLALYLVSTPTLPPDAANTKDVELATYKISPPLPEEMDVDLPLDLSDFPSLPNTAPPLPPLSPSSSFPTATPSLHDILSDAVDKNVGRLPGSLSLLSLLPLMHILQDWTLPGMYQVTQMVALQSSCKLVLYMCRTELPTLADIGASNCNRPFPSETTEVKGQQEPSTGVKVHDNMPGVACDVEVKGDWEGPLGCLAVMEYSWKGDGRVALHTEPLVRSVTASPGEVIVDMCCVGGEGEGVGWGGSGSESGEVLVVVTTRGEVKILDLDTLNVSGMTYMYMYGMYSTCMYSTCIHCDLKGCIMLHVYDCRVLPTDSIFSQFHIQLVRTCTVHVSPIHEHVYMHLHVHVHIHVDLMRFHHFYGE